MNCLVSRALGPSDLLMMNRRNLLILVMYMVALSVELRVAACRAAKSASHTEYPRVDPVVRLWIKIHAMVERGPLASTHAPVSNITVIVTSFLGSFFPIPTDFSHTAVQVTRPLTSTTVVGMVY